jgi:hypothetical protein
MMRGPGSRDLRLTESRYPLASKLVPGVPTRTGRRTRSLSAGVVLGGILKKSNFKLKLEQFKWHRDCAVRTRT